MSVQQAIIDRMREHNLPHMVVNVFENPPFAYTVGLYRLHGFELLVFGLPHEVAHVVLNMIASDLTDGVKLETGKLYSKSHTPKTFWTNMPIRFEHVKSSATRYTLQADYFADQIVDVLQIVLCDKNGRFPEDKDFEDVMRKTQPILY